MVVVKCPLSLDHLISPETRCEQVHWMPHDRGSQLQMAAKGFSPLETLPKQMSGLLLDETGAGSKEVDALIGLQDQYDQLVEQHRKEIQDLEKKFLTSCQPLCQQRCAVINGEGPKPAIPMFWVKAIRNHPALKVLVEDHDVEALSHLRDISITIIEDEDLGGFCLTFHFGSNPFFEETELHKRYYLGTPTKADYGSDIYDHAEGTVITWKEGKNLCFKTITKTQRHKSSGNVRSVTKTETQRSFFHFFAPPTIPDSCEDLDEVDAESLEDSLQADFELGEVFRTKIIPNAVEWYTGKALEYEDACFSDDEYDECGESCESDGSASESSEGRQVKAATAGPNEQCKQQ